MKANIPWAKPLFFEQEQKYLADALASTWISGGQYIEKFEKEFTQYNRAHFGITTSNGTTALQLAIWALNLQPGDEVIVPGFTFVAPINMVIESGATPIYADIDPATWCIDPVAIESCITGKTKAVVPVHIYGNVCEMDTINSIAKKHNRAVIEDTAEAAFSKYGNKYAGTLGDIGCFSFQATKTITMGEGGCVLTENEQLYKAMRLIRDHGMRIGKRYWHDVIGYNFRLTNMQAAVGCGQLENVSAIIAEKKRVFLLYTKFLSDIAGVTMQHFSKPVDPVVWAIAVKVDPLAFKFNRDAIINQMQEKGIETRPGFYPFSVMPLYHAPALPVSEEVGANVLSLPSFPSLSEEEIAFICENLKKLRR
ncbi:MAG: DegT/DnrJ/EryC1/StrS family aminotransferase [Candidatus Margulisiibacteriota bacterium]